SGIAPIMPIITVKPPLNVEQKFDNVTVVHDVLLAYAAVKAKGLQRTEGKEYVVNDGDVIEFLFNV
ncbi:MAG: DUF933 domain-containing protein, partial [Gemmiger formicilis]|nr:DUF933 domain-containing protein [Gemmiger formicilis]